MAKSPVACGLLTSSIIYHFRLSVVRLHVSYRISQHGTLVLTNRCSFYMLEKVQLGLGLILHRPVSDLVKVFARMRCLHASKHSLFRLTPFPKYRADIRRALERLSQLLVAMLHVENIVKSFFRA